MRSALVAVLVVVTTVACLPPFSTAQKPEPEKKDEPISKADEILDGLPATARPKPDKDKNLDAAATIDLVEARLWLHKKMVGKTVRWKSTVDTVWARDNNTTLNMEVFFSMPRSLCYPNSSRLVLTKSTFSEHPFVVRLDYPNFGVPTFSTGTDAARKILALKGKEVECLAKVTNTRFQWIHAQETDSVSKVKGENQLTFVLDLICENPTLDGWKP